MKGRVNWKAVKWVSIIFSILMIVAYAQELTNIRNELSAHLGTYLIYASGDMQEAGE